MAPKIVDKEAKKARIISAAIQVFSQKGITKSKMSDVANAAGIGKGTIYEYFRSKEEIFHSAFKSMFAEMGAMTQEAIAKQKNPVDQLKTLIAITLDFHKEDAGEFAGIMMDFWAEGIRNKNNDIIEFIDLKSIYQDYRTLIASIVEAGTKQGLFKVVDTLAYAAITIAMLDGIFLQIIMEPGLIDVEKVKQTLTETLIEGLLNQ